MPNSASRAPSCDLNHGPINVAEDGIDWGDAVVEQHQAQAMMGQIPFVARIPNRIITVPLLLGAAGRASFASCRRQLQAKVALFQRKGGSLRRGNGLYADIMSASLKMPDRYGHLGVESDVILTLEALPDFYGDEIELDLITETSAAEIAAVLQLDAADAVIEGDYAARVRIVVSDDEGESRNGLLWGLRSRHYDDADTAALAYEAEDLTPLDAATIATVTGASGGASNNVVRHPDLSTSWTPVLSTEIDADGHMTHTGSYRVWARAYSTSSTPPKLRLVWDVGDLLHPSENARATIPAASNFYLIDVGEVRLDEVGVGTHRWQGVIQAQGAAGGENISIDKVWLQPLDESAGTLYAPVNSDVGLAAYTARDEFNQSAGALTGKTASVGGTWTGDGDTNDFSVETTFKTAQRTALLDNSVGRIALSGVSAMAGQVVQVDVKASARPTVTLRQGCVARGIDEDNHVYAALGTDLFEVAYWVAGNTTPLGTVAFVQAPDAWYTVRLMVEASGVWHAWIFRRGAVPGSPALWGFDAALATGGALATGKPGMLDGYFDNVPAIVRNYDNFAAWVPTPDAVLHADQSAELSTRGIVREDSTGAAYGPASHVTGDLPRLPVSGLEDRPVELFVLATRGDLDQVADSGIDDIRAQVFYRPCWLFPQAD